MEDKIVFLQLSSLHKVFLDEDYSPLKEVDGISALKGERVSYQILYAGGKERKTQVSYKIKADENLKISLYSVGNIPSLLPSRKNEDDEYYLRKTAGLYPDILYPKTDDNLEVVLENCHSLYITVETNEKIKAGLYPIEIEFTVNEEKITKTFTIKIIDAVLPKQELIYTQWFHADCISSYYKYEIFSDEHWEMIEKFIKMAAHTGINLLLTPVFTLPLDTEVGRERPTVQLVDVKVLDDGYEFGFSRLKKWIDICKKYGINAFEISHLFSQWGTGCTPKIVANTKNGEEKIFGWHTKADSVEYRDFLNAFLPELTEFLKVEGVWENTYFHISDEPDYEKHFEIYKTEREMLEGLIPAEKIMDAISAYQFCECGLVTRPVAITCSVDEFYEHGYKNIWTYYCEGPCDRGYSNRFVSMPSGRNRIIGFQLYKYGIGGFLHWGYNFYYSAFSKKHLNPFYNTDANESFPSGDAFSVYPGEDGPLESLRTVAFYEGLQDQRACKLLESYIGKEAVDEIINMDGEIKFNEYPRTDEGVLEIRNRINKKLEEVI